MNKKRLSGTQQWLVEQCQQLNFGRITFHVRHGEPDLARAWRTRRTVKLASGENSSRPETDLLDFELCKEQTALLNTVRHVRDDTCVTVEARHGLPFLVEIVQDHQTA